MEKNFTEQDSLKLINEMISQARNNFQKGAGNDFIFAGYSVAIVSIINFILLYTLDNPNNSYWIWLMMIPMQLGFRLIDKKRHKDVLIKTHIDVIVKNIWRAYRFSVIVFLISVFGTAYAVQSMQVGIMITPVLLMMTGLAQYATGTCCRFKLYHIGAGIFWLGAIAAVASYFTGTTNIQFIILAVSIILGFVVPGHIANKKAKQYV